MYKNCSNCNSILNLRNTKYCSNKCQFGYQTKQKAKKALKIGNANDLGIKSIRSILKYIRGRQCEVCKNTKWQNQPIPLEVDHMDGNSYNNDLNNIRLICCNCHALTDTYKGKNKGNGRHSRRIRYKNGQSY